MRLLEMPADEAEIVSLLPSLLTASSRHVAGSFSKSSIQLFDVRQSGRLGGRGVLLRMLDSGKQVKALDRGFPHLGRFIGKAHGRRLEEFIAQMVGSSHQHDPKGFFFDLSTNSSLVFCYLQNAEGELHCYIFTSGGSSPAPLTDVVEGLARLDRFVEKCTRKTAATSILWRQLAKHLWLL